MGHEFFLTQFEAGEFISEVSWGFWDHLDGLGVVQTLRYYSILERKQLEDRLVLRQLFSSELWELGSWPDQLRDFRGQQKWKEQPRINKGQAHQAPRVAARVGPTVKVLGFRWWACPLLIRGCSFHFCCPQRCLSWWKCLFFQIFEIFRIFSNFVIFFVIFFLIYFFMTTFSKNLQNATESWRRFRRISQRRPG